jgi:PAS domain S-box-containing protein
MYTDITGRKKAEEALQESERRHRALFEEAIDAIFVADIETGILIDCNESALRLVGKERSEIIGSHQKTLHPPETSDGKFSSTFLKHRDQLQVETIETTVVTKSGEIKYVAIRASAIELKGRKIMQGNFRDITKRKKAEDDLRRSEKKLRDITSHLAEGIYVLDKEGKLTFMNTEAERLFGYTMDEMNKNNPHDLVHYLKPDGTPLLFEECKMHNVIKTGERYMSQNEVFIRKDGTVFPVSVITAPIIEDGRIIASVTAFRDITAYKKLDEEVLKAHKLESVGILAGGIAHDFNNLMQAIVGNVHVAKMHCQSGDKAFQRLTDAEKVLEQAKELSFRLLTFSKGGMPIKKLMSIKHLLSESNDLLRDSNISTEYSISNDLYPVEIDEGQMRQVFRNIIINAKEAMPDGGTLKVTATNVKLNKDNTFNIKDGNYVKISIQDNGTGISQEHLSKIFDPYFSTKQRYADKGLGLGLSVCYSIMKNHGGHIVAESIEGKGTTLHLYLPAKESR